MFAPPWPFLRHPLVICAAIGLVLAGGLRLLRPFSRQCISVSKATLDGLSADFARRSGRPPTSAERELLVSDYIDGEVLFREAEARHLGDGDIIIRRRLVQKMEFVVEGLGKSPEPQPAELKSYFAAHKQRYLLPARVSLRHVFISRDRHKDDASAVAKTLLSRLRAENNFAGLGDPFLRGAEFENASQSELLAIFGPDFAAAALALPISVWSEPIPSSYGLHLIFVSARQAEAEPALSAVFTRVRQDFVYDRKKILRQKTLERLRRGYDIAAFKETP